MVKSLGPNEVIGYTQDDFAQLGTKYDVIMDTAGTASYSRCKSCLKEDGRLLVVLGGVSELLLVPIVASTSKKRIVAGPAAERLDDLEQLAKLVRDAKLAPVIDRTYPVDEIVEAYRYIDTARKKGSVVIQWIN